MKLLLLLSPFFIFHFAAGQNIFSQSELDYKKPFAPYELQNIIGLDDQETIILMEDGKGKFRLARYDKYFFDQWSVLIDYEREGSFPKLFRLGNEAIVFRFWTHKDQAFAEAHIYNAATGALINHIKKNIIENSSYAGNATIAFSEDRSQFVVYNYQSEDGAQELFDLYDTKTLELKKTYHTNSGKTLNKTKNVFIGDDGSLFIALADAGTFMLETYFFNRQSLEPVVLSSGFSFQRPAGKIPALQILKQSESAFWVMVPAYIENELVGMNISSFNVVLKTVLYSNSFDVDQNFIKSAYAQSLFTSERQRKKHIATPGSLENFMLQDVFSDSRGGITCIFESQEWPSAYHDPSLAMNKPLKWKQPDDVYYFNEDLMFVNFSAAGDISWKKVIQKTQYGHQHGLGLSYVARVFNDELKIAMRESAKGNSLYTCTIDLLNGGVVGINSFFDKKMDINKNYSGWIDEKTLLLCAFPEGSKRRSLYLVEF